MHPPVDVRRLTGVTPDQEQLALVALAFDQHVELAPDERAQPALADRLLRLHQLTRAPLDRAGWPQLVEGAAVRALLVRVAKHADVIELGAAHEFKQLAEVFLGLARVPDDESGPDEQARHA